MDRRKFLQALGALSSATLLSSCGSEKGQKTLISLLVPPEDGVLPGEARWIPTACTECPAGCGMQVRLREGRAVKLEGIPEHPIGRGGLCMRGQAGLWRLYHPERIRSPLLKGDDGAFREIGWDEAMALVDDGLRASAAEGRRSVYLSGRTTGTLGEVIDHFCSRRQVERLPEFELFSHAALRRAYGEVFGVPDLPHYRIEEADLLVSVGADLLETFVSPVDFAAQVTRAKESPDFRWVHLESTFTLTGANAHERLDLRPGSEPYLLGRLLQGVSGGSPLPGEIARSLRGISGEEAARQTGIGAARLEALAAELSRAERPLLICGGLSLAHAGGPLAAVLAALLQERLGMVGNTIDFSRRENYAKVGSMLDVERLARSLEREEIGVLFVSRADPVGLAPETLQLPANIRKAQFRVGLGTLIDKSMEEMDLLLPLSHPLETWGDAAPRGGVRTILRPAIAPLHPTRAEGEILLELAGEALSWQEHLFSRWREAFGDEGMEAFSRDGFLEREEGGESPSFNPQGVERLLGESPRAPLPATPVLAVTPSIRHFDGRGRALPLLSEVPDPLTTVSWGEWVSVPENFAETQGVKDRQMTRLTVGGWSTELPAKIQPFQPGGTYAVQRSLLPGAPYGFESVAGEAVLLLEGLRAEKMRRRGDLAVLAGSKTQQGRGIIPDPKHREEYHRVSLYPEHEYPIYRWGMAVDLERCIGCGGCVAACYAENNVPVTGMKNHLRGREMSWLRIEPYYDAPGGVGFLPMLCQHCRYAPCEPVCPVYAAYHNNEGLNVQVYNRCVGTRYCSNNCPYKVRRFNWWQHRWPEPSNRMLNPDISVRTRGMMEKCTFCIQRIRKARDLAKDEGRTIRDGEVTTACAQSCPTGAIVFGNLLDEGARISALAASERAHRVFELLGTEPAVFYLPKNSRSGAMNLKPRAES